MVLGGLGAFVAFLRDASGVATRDGSYKRLRRNLGRCILLGLEVLIVGDIVRTIVVAPTYESVTVLGIIVVIRILLSFSLEVEIDGFGHGTGGATLTASRVPLHCSGPIPSTQLYPFQSKILGSRTIPPISRSEQRSVDAARLRGSLSNSRGGSERRAYA